jgi:hypothetical protein
MQRIARTALIFILFAAPALAQQREPPKPTRPAQQPKEGDQTPKPAAQQSKEGEQAPKPVVVPPEGMPVNVRVEITITDQRGDAPPIAKTVTKTVADRTWGRIRTNADVITKMGPRQVVLNVDTFPRVLPKHVAEGKLKVDMTIDYRPVAAEADTEKSSTAVINETLTVILDDGKPMVVSQSADPTTDRKVKVEVKATILK